MRILVLQDDLHKYLAFVVESYARRGINPEEGQSLFYLHKAIGAARLIPDNQVAKVGVNDSGTATLSVEAKEGDKLGPLQEVERPTLPVDFPEQAREEE